MAKINGFKAYDIRGVYGVDFDAETARRIAHFAVIHLDARRVVLSRDMRSSSPEIASVAIQGIMDAGAHCLNIGQASTPMNYFAAVHLDADASIQITASHNPGEYNGFKISRRGAQPVDQRRCRQAPAQRVFAPAPAQQQNLHRAFPFSLPGTPRPAPCRFGSTARQLVLSLIRGLAAAQWTSNGNKIGRAAWRGRV